MQNPIKEYPAHFVCQVEIQTVTIAWVFQAVHYSYSVYLLLLFKQHLYLKVIEMTLDFESKLWFPLPER